MSPPSISPIDVRVRVIEVALTPALTLARVMALPLDDLQHLVATGYFREARARGMSFRSIARRFGKSLRTITSIAQRAASHDPLRDAHRQLGFRRRAVAWLAAEGPAALDALARAVPDAGADTLRREIEYLVEQRILLQEGEIYRVIGAHLDMQARDLSARLESLRHLLDGVTMVIHQRFFEPQSKATALARVLTFDADPEALAQLATESYARLREAVIDADGAAGPERVQAALTLTVAETPTGPGWSRR